MAEGDKRVIGMSLRGRVGCSGKGEVAWMDGARGG